MHLGSRTRLALLFAALAMVTAMVTAGVASASTSRKVRTDVDDFLRTRAIEIAEGRRGAPPGRNADVDRRTDARSSDSDLTSQNRSVQRSVDADAIVQILDRRGDPLGSSGRSLPVDELDRRMSEIPAPASGAPRPALVRTVIVDGDDYRMVTLHLRGGGAVQVAQASETTNALVGQIRSELWALGAILSAIAGLIGWGVASRATRPLRRLTRDVESIRDTQDLDRSVALDRTDELGTLARAFDELLRGLADSRRQQHQLVQDAAHELRTPLTSVRANVAFLERAVDLDSAERQATLGSIRGELTELSELLAEVVELATETGDAVIDEPVDLVVAAEAAIAQFELRSSRPVQRTMASTVVQGDHVALTRAIGNLIANADKYTPEPDAAIEVRVGDGTVTVLDRGQGITTADADRVFERFWRADSARSASGSGLGLAIVKKAVDEHGGSVFAGPRPGGGSEIGFRLPTPE